MRGLAALGVGPRRARKGEAAVLFRSRADAQIPSTWVCDQKRSLAVAGSGVGGGVCGPQAASRQDLEVPLTSVEGMQL